LVALNIDAILPAENGSYRDCWLAGTTLPASRLVSLASIMVTNWSNSHHVLSSNITSKAIRSAAR